MSRIRTYNRRAKRRLEQLAAHARAGNRLEAWPVTPIEARHRLRYGAAWHRDKWRNILGLAEERACDVCGCTEDRACVVDGVPCGWAGPRVCTACI